MTPENVRAMVNRIAGAFPTNDVYRENVVDAWSHDDVIVAMSVEQGRALTKKIVAECNFFPKLKEVHNFYYRLFVRSDRKCEICNGVLWIIPTDENGQRVRRKIVVKKLDDGTELTQDYHYVVRCVCSPITTE